ncbi:MAG: tRNA pseudouridine(38-40) synthase TruA [Candidatus Freyarchaeota archaeon]|nr:tRNA pseudouridine(38-40) synthase TruA [Candidatus Jordarchaeia archaeon]MBS7269468.1 tRNA pseudouridine(38-40) synthase TruA [Candidatus Jordarchaeia archaeon]MBS7278763.1 tRNA pseudouridine(38-40) synthase TruA [Candidatus Jordarchaeia archaeon]
MRYAVRLAYIGGNYSGFQRQPNMKTVEGTVIEALKKVGWIEDEEKANYNHAGRTDQGVNALSQTIAFNTSEKIILPALNNSLPRDISCWAYAPVAESFNPRRDALLRTYKYYAIYEGENLRIMKKAASLLKGTHDFKNLCTPRPNRRTIRTLFESKIEKRGDLLIFTFSSKGFLRKMVRKTVTALRKIGSGEKNLQYLKDLLNPNYEPRGGVAPAEPSGLILFDIKYPFNFFVDEVSRKIFLKTLYKNYIHARIRAQICKVIISELEKTS